MKKRKMLVTGGIVTTLLLSGSHAVLAQNNQNSSPITQETLTVGTETGQLADTEDYNLSYQTGIAAQNDLAESDSKELRSIFFAQGFSSAQIQNLLTRDSKLGKNSDWLEY